MTVTVTVTLTVALTRLRLPGARCLGGLRPGGRAVGGQGTAQRGALLRGALARPVLLRTVGGAGLGQHVLGGRGGDGLAHGCRVPIPVGGGRRSGGRCCLGRSRGNGSLPLLNGRYQLVLTHPTGTADAEGAGECLQFRQHHRGQTGTGCPPAPGRQGGVTGGRGRIRRTAVGTCPGHSGRRGGRIACGVG